MEKTVTEAINYRRSVRVYKNEAIDSKKVSVDPETFEIRDGKLYLFYNSWGINTLKKWKKNNVKGLQKKADQNWEAIKN